MKLLLAISLIFLLITIQDGAAFAEDFESYMQEWNEKRELATQYLRDAERALKEGDEAISCTTQRKASKYGIEATESLIKAMKINGSTDGIENFELGLNKWRELRDFC
ncbi:hypothetical protein [Prochlorococcus sp. MIT 1307]|uniref:hypothetical protein n=1 Tax=Prochlorococcus sp. MIT 1307 TaxID=3096219 RepID=UPI002A7502CF|nr:hypothetical protein [Prochlorococcus sp. MIT 1307]